MPLLTSIHVHRSQTGGQNCHLDIVFEDGVTWIARIKLADSPHMPPQEAQDLVFLSEIATIKYLTEFTSIPVPVVHHYQLRQDPDNKVGLSYVLMDKLPGTPLCWDDADPKNRQKVMDQLSDICIEMEKYPFKKAGSLVLQEKGESTIAVGGYTQLPYFVDAGHPLGPFESLRDSLNSLFEHQKNMIINREIAVFPLDNYLGLLWCLEKVSTLLSAADNGMFFLKHQDDKGDHILIDKDYNITGIIDWEFASLEPKPIAFASPCMMWPVGDFYDGKNGLSEDELYFAECFKRRGREDIAEVVMDGRKFQRFLFHLGGWSKDEMEMKNLFDGLRKAFGEEDTYDEWYARMLEKYTLLQPDEGLMQLLTRENN
ncbi:hypothetical protein BJ508DRAFT_370441 [Ascobolus immersus RN42]|uniref:Aminoglycoside phosphotransferase domain-containing protein n=1 Tax=Ascobolus immersus RN42 TaxID=1160509 RepID=A0A3N4I1D9_ASCIM|nr:hypothetical protein BJ508DRAFT_370441 [Ascobolus immersus RN42]